MIAINPIIESSLKHALKQRRQFTFGEQVQARELLAHLEREALRHFGVHFADKTPDKGDGADIRALKRRGLFEVALLSEEPGAALTDEQRSMIGAVLREACGDFNQHGHHHSAALLPSAPSARPAPRAIVGEDPRVADLLARVEKCEAQLASLMSSLGVSADDAGAASPEVAAGIADARLMPAPAHDEPEHAPVSPEQRLADLNARLGLRPLPASSDPPSSSSSSSSSDPLSESGNVAGKE